MRRRLRQAAGRSLLHEHPENFELGVAELGHDVQDVKAGKVLSLPQLDFFDIQENPGSHFNYGCDGCDGSGFPAPSNPFNA